MRRKDRPDVGKVQAGCGGIEIMSRRKITWTELRFLNSIWTKNIIQR